MFRVLGVTAAGRYSTCRGLGGLKATCGGKLTKGGPHELETPELQSEIRSKVFPITPESTIQVVVLTNCVPGLIGSAFATSHGFTLFGAMGCNGVRVSWVVGFGGRGGGDFDSSLSPDLGKEGRQIVSVQRDSYLWISLATEVGGQGPCRRVRPSHRIDWGVGAEEWSDHSRGHLLSQ